MNYFKDNLGKGKICAFRKRKWELKFYSNYNGELKKSRFFFFLAFYISAMNAVGKNKTQGLDSCLSQTWTIVRSRVETAAKKEILKIGKNKV